MLEKLTGGSLEFLVVEDDPGTADGIGRLLSPFGQSCICGSLAGALESIAARDFDGVVIDILLPDGSGLGVLDRLRAQGRETPALVLTGTSVEEYQQHTMLAHALYLPKPATP